MSYPTVDIYDTATSYNKTHKEKGRNKKEYEVNDENITP